MLTTSSLTSLEKLADSLGVRVRTAPTPGTRWGVYDHGHKLITMKPGLGVAQYRSTLAHELGHAHYGHACHSTKAERQADRWAARHLLTYSLIAEGAARSVDMGELAADLDVLPWVIKVFVETLNEHETRSLLAIVRRSA